MIPYVVGSLQTTLGPGTGEQYNIVCFKGRQQLQAFSHVLLHYLRCVYIPSPVN